MPKTKDNIRLLDLSIKKWQRITYFGHADDGISDCALCVNYAVEQPMHRCCKGCPIHADTGKILCSDTPYTHYSRCEDDFEFSLITTPKARHALRTAANHMLVYLHQLRHTLVCSLHSHKEAPNA